MRSWLALVATLLLLLTQAVFCQGDAPKKEAQEKIEKREVLRHAREAASDPENPWSRMNPMMFSLYDQLRPKADEPPAEGLTPQRYPLQGPFQPGNIGYPFGYQQAVPPLLSMMYPWPQLQDGYMWGGGHDDDDSDVDDDDDDDGFYPHDDHALLPGGYPFEANPHADSHEHLSGGDASGEIPDHDSDEDYPDGHPFGGVPHDHHLPGGYPFGAFPHDDHFYPPSGYPYLYGAAPYGARFPLPGGYPYPYPYPFGAFPYDNRGDYFQAHGGYPTGAFPLNGYFPHQGGYPYPLGGAWPYDDHHDHFHDGYPPYAFGAFPSAVLPFDHLSGHVDPMPAFQGWQPGYGWDGYYPGGHQFHGAYGPAIEDYLHYDAYPWPILPNSDSKPEKQPTTEKRPSNESITKFLEAESWITTNVFNTTKTTKEVAGGPRTRDSQKDRERERRPESFSFPSFLIVFVFVYRLCSCSALRLAVVCSLCLVQKEEREI